MVDAWVLALRRFWSAYMDALERQLDRADHTTPAKKIGRVPRGLNRERDKGEANENQSN
ncbi:MAG TPA: hypothetical protein VMB47_12590 [Candidatus Aquilonibacter sp.]|nr:hypothetical protein [Candidatus Aquilonibacter sp.]